jgi:hypothetical protein
LKYWNFLEEHRKTAYIHNGNVVKQWYAFIGTEKRIIQTIEIKFIRRGTGQRFRDEIRDNYTGTELQIK